MCKLLLNKPVKDKTNFISRFFISTQYKIFELSSRYRKGTIIAFCVLLALCVVRFMFWGTEFIPNMNEGAIYIRAILPNSVNLDESVEITQQMKQKLRKFEEVKFVLSQTGHPNDGTDATGFFNIEFHAELKPEKEWTRKIKKDDLIQEIQDSLDIYPGVIFGFSQPIQDNSLLNCYFIS